MLGESIFEAFVRHPDESLGIRGEFRRLRMWFITMEDLSNGLAFVWSQRGDVDQRLNALVIHCGDNSTGISMCR
jgi:hypothetical protein